jgi:type 1 glutamine amidotransferase
MSLRALVLCDDTWHPAETVRQGLTALGNCGFAFDYLEDGAAWTAARMNEFPLVVLAKANITSSTESRPWLAADTQQAFQDYLRRDHGIVVVHSGSSGYEKLPMMHRVIGGAFRSHPDQCPVTVEPKAAHPLTRGVAPFTVKDEHYMMSFDATDADLFLHTRSEHGVQPAGWTRTEGSGRVCVLTPGHNLEVWLHPCYQALLRNSLHWAAKTN